MKKSAHAHSALIRKRQFRARIVCKECGRFNEVGRKQFFLLHIWIIQYFKNTLLKFQEEIRCIKDSTAISRATLEAQVT